VVVLSRVTDDTSSGVQDSLELVGEGLGCTGENSVAVVHTRCFQNISPVIEFIAHHVGTTQATPTYWAVVSAVARRFLTISASSATSEHLFLRLVGCRLTLFTSAAPIHGQSCIFEGK